LHLKVSQALSTNSILDPPALIDALKDDILMFVDEIMNKLEKEEAKETTLILRLRMTQTLILKLISKLVIK
jgi:hypothetical protein